MSSGRRCSVERARRAAREGSAIGRTMRTSSLHSMVLSIMYLATWIRDSCGGWAADAMAATQKAAAWSEQRPKALLPALPSARCLERSNVTVTDESRSTDLKPVRMISGMVLPGCRSLQPQKRRIGRSAGSTGRLVAHSSGRGQAHTCAAGARRCPQAKATREHRAGVHCLQRRRLGRGRAGAGGCRAEAARVFCLRHRGRRLLVEGRVFVLQEFVQLHTGTHTAAPAGAIRHHHLTKRTACAPQWTRGPTLHSAVDVSSSQGGGC